MKFKQKCLNIKTVYKEWSSYVVTVAAGIALAALMLYFTDFATVSGNLGRGHAIAEGVLLVLLSVLFGMNAALLWYKLKLSSSVNAKESGTFAVGSFLGALVSGCSACGISLASYLGLASVVSALPFFGLELKVVGVGLLLYSTNSLSRDLFLCKVKK